MVCVGLGMTFFEWKGEKMNRGMVICLAGALLFGAGCAAAGNAADTENAAMVMTYQTGSAEEEVERLQLAVRDAAARVKIPPLLQAAQEASAIYHGAAMALSSPELPPEARRPTKEEVEALRKKMKEAWAVVIEARKEQVERYSGFLAKYPQNWHVRHRLAWFMADHYLRFEAAEEWRKVIKIEPRFPYAYNNLGSLYNHMGRDMEAIDLFLRAIELKPDDPTFYMNLAANYAVHRDEVAEKFGWDTPRVFRETIACYANAQKLAPGDKAITWQFASQYVVAKRFGVEDSGDEAITAWEKYLKLDLTEAERAVASRNIGRIYLKEKDDPAKAVKWLERALKLSDDPTNRLLLKQARAALQNPGAKE